MDLRVGEELLRRLEIEAAKVERLGALREEFDKLMPLIRVAVQTMQQSSRELHDLGPSISRSLQENGGSIKVELTQLQKTVHTQSIDTAAAVTSKVETAVGSLQTSLRSDFQTLAQQVDLGRGRLEHYIVSEISKLRIEEEARASSLRRLIRNYSLGVAAFLLSVGAMLRYLS